MRIIDVIGKPCPIPVIEAKKSLAEHDAKGVLVKVDNIVAVQNLEKMAKGYGYLFSYSEKAKNFFEAVINKDGSGSIPAGENKESETVQNDKPSKGLAVVIGSNTMGLGSEELGKILIKGFIYSLTELPVPPKCVVFLNSGAYLTSNEANTIDDLKKLEQRGAEILTCGTCVNYYGLGGIPAVGNITDMYGITERMAAANNVINI
jgi:selenium metabolism protein YedF